MRSEAELLLVAPKDGGSTGYLSLAQNIMQIDNLVPAVVTNQNKKGTVAQKDVIFDERSNPLINLLLGHPDRKFEPGSNLVLGPQLIELEIINKASLISLLILLLINCSFYFEREIKKIRRRVGQGAETENHTRI